MTFTIRKRNSAVLLTIAFFGSLVFVQHYRNLAFSSIWDIQHNDNTFESKPEPKACDKSDDYCFTYRSEAKLAFLTSYFQADNVERKGELDICLASLFGCQVLDQIHVLIEKNDIPALPSIAAESPKLRISIIKKRPLMGDFIQYACDHLQGYRVLYANSDISYDLTLEYFKKMSDKVFDNTFYAISRWWLTDNGMTPSPYPEWGSYDTFVFSPKTLCQDKTKLKEIVSNLNYTLGISGAENRLLYEVKRQYPELQMINPVYTVKTVHHHNSPYRAKNYDDYVHKGGKSVTIEPPFIV
ncbi:hypothetical protein BGX21_004982 [Mortierella sp. AD011]|nr:hypothetical protein BGX21_004982 [Mortierella sp. AD011]